MSRSWLELKARWRTMLSSARWAETVQVGLFPGDCWIKRKRDQAAQAFQAPEQGDGQALLRSLEQRLDQQPLPKGSRVALTVSDGLAAIALMPWQDALRSREEVGAYARICFEKTGLAINDTWLAHAEFRRYGGMGLAYAFPRAWLEQLAELLAARDLRLSEVLPASAAAYFRLRQRKQPGQALLLLQEQRRISVMHYGPNGLIDYDVEPVTGSVDAACNCLLNRAVSAYGQVGRAALWSSRTAGRENNGQILQASFPGIELIRLHREAWS